MADRPGAHRLSLRVALALFLSLTAAAQAETLRLATYNVALSRDYAGHLVRDVERRDQPILQIAAVLREVAPDIVLLTEMDRDPQLRALAGLQQILAEQGLIYPHSYAGPVNAGVMTGLDLDGDGWVNDPEDAQGWGKWPGHRGMALLSRYPIGPVRTFRLSLWDDVPGSMIPTGEPAQVRAIQRLSSKSHWDIGIALPQGGTLHVLAAHPTPPVFDGAQDRNGRRNADEIAWFNRYLDGEAMRDDAGLTAPLAPGPVAVLADLNADPFDGGARRGPLRTLLGHPRLQDPAPTSRGAVIAGVGGANDAHLGPADQDTADWRDDPGPGNLRVDYVLPDARLSVSGAGVFWPIPDAPLHEEAMTSDHRLVWVDVDLP